MGACGAKDNLTPQERAALEAEAKKNKELDQAMKKAQVDDLQFNKLLLLGAGESGKSTLFKQMISIHGEGFPPEVRKTYVNIIHNNAITAMKTLCEQTVHLHEQHGYNTLVQPEAVAALNLMKELKMEAEFDGKVVEAIRTLWADPGIRETYDHRAKFQLTDSSNYWFDRVEELGQPNYIPSEQDVLRSRVRTTGIVEQIFNIEGNRFKMFDVGGQRNERKKWIHCFEDVTALLFVAALSEYDMVLFEDETVNRMHEALNLFGDIINQEWFKRTSVILFLNKKDLFAEKIEKVPLSICFPEYQGANEFEEAASEIEFRFVSLNKNKSKTIYTHLTNATDSNNMKYVFNSVKDIVVRRSLQEGGLLAV